jgi:serine phosphatase RsbU (regulator of sigma subunit)
MNSLQKVVMITFNSVGIFIGGLYLIFQVKNSNNKYRIDLLKERESVLKKNKKIERQVEIIAETNKEITDSINYSKRIQNAILPSTAKVKKLMPESFILYKPKDIVAGDFYWVEKTQNNLNFAVADCTGHGVPGAMMSVICTNALNRSLNEFNLIKPNEILDKTRSLVIQDLDASEDNIKDGMDIALCSLSGNILNYSGANIKLYIVRGKEIIEYKPNKQPIGLYIGEQTAYTNHTIELQKDDCIYLITDGYVDQFGGEKLKKFKTPALKKLLIDINELSMLDQGKIVLSTFENWKRNLEQIDDVCVMGIKFNK